MAWYKVYPSSYAGKPIPPSFPLTVSKLGGGTVTLVRREWATDGSGVVGVDAEGGRWRHREADGLVEAV